MILRAESKAEAANPQLQAVQEPMISVFHVPVVKKPSPIISQEQFEVIWQWLPSRYQVPHILSASLEILWLILCLPGQGPCGPFHLLQ